MIVLVVFVNFSGVFLLIFLFFWFFSCLFFLRLLLRLLLRRLEDCDPCGEDGILVDDWLRATMRVASLVLAFSFTESAIQISATN